MTRDILDTADPVLNRIPRKLREQYVAAWDKYQSCCVTGGTPEQRQYAYEQARCVEEKFNVAVLFAKAEIKRENAKRAKPPVLKVGR